MNIKVCLLTIFLSFILGIVNCEEYQNKDPYVSNYRENDSDGYSWRKREINYIRTDNIITKEKLLSTLWVKDPLSEPSNVLVFYKDDVFNLGSYQAGVVIAGKYEIIDNVVKLVRNENIYNKPYAGFDNNTLYLKFITSANNFFYEHSLSSEKTSFFALGSEYSNGSNAVFNNINIIRMNKTIVANDNVNARIQPDVKSDKYKYSFYDYSLKISNGLILRGTIIEMLGHTPNNVIIDNKSSSWYLLKMWIEESYVYVWTFGAYFDDYIITKKGEYEELLSKEILKRQ